MHAGFGVLPTQLPYLPTQLPYLPARCIPIEFPHLQTQQCMPERGQIRLEPLEMAGLEVTGQRLAMLGQCLQQDERGAVDLLNR